MSEIGMALLYATPAIAGLAFYTYAIWSSDPSYDIIKCNIDILDKYYQTHKYTEPIGSYDVFTSDTITEQIENSLKLKYIKAYEADDLKTRLARVMTKK